MVNTSSITHDELIPASKWQFDSSVTDVFEDMLQRSIPQYDVMRQAVYGLACQYIQPKTAVLDIGSSRGESVARLIDTYALRNRFILCEVSQPMLDVLQERFAHYVEMGSVSIRDIDLRQSWVEIDTSVTLSILTLQFIPIEYRQKILAQIYANTIPGGCLILVEKVLGDSADLNQKMVDIYYALKSSNDYTVEQIERKRLSLEGVLVPVTAAWNEDMLRSAGFNQIDCFWRWMNFAGWIAIK